MIKFGEKLPTLEQVHYLLICEAMKRAGGDAKKAGELIGCSRQNINKRLKKWKEQK